ncbi:Gldg family protein [uncultured Butyricimonas sp.]|uniref:Gldg family protein n=1 Tax=uncultured Butyricimonas sp. TaxID=1268785 RepID=UPI0026DBB630|nr:Gldg family protein [uncultured Butyricimonas sp.]
MKMAFKIAKMELQSLFFSPVAWLLLVVFAYQVGMTISDSLEGIVVRQAMGYEMWRVTGSVFAGLMESIQGSLYLYIPLLTMNMISRDLNGGTIKLLQSAPLRNIQVVAGKYMALMVFGLAMMGVILFYVIFGLFTIENIDIPYVLTGILGLYLLLCAYAAIGLFVSSLTSYQVVAVFGTLMILILFNYVGDVGQNYEFVRDITYWLSIRGRVFEFIYGLICSEDVLYFLIVIAIFLTWTTLRLINRVQKRGWTVRWGAYLGVFVLAMGLGYLSSRPMLMSYYDATRTKGNTLSEGSQNIVKLLDGKVKITTYTNVLDKEFWSTLPDHINHDMGNFRDYVRFKPDMKLRYVYFYDNAGNEELDEQYPDLNDRERAERICDNYGIPFSIFLSPEEMKKIEDLSAEGNKTIRVIERENGQKSYLRFYYHGGWKESPMEGEISAAFKRLVMDVPTIGFLTGHGERDINREADREYKRISSDRNIRSSMVNQGFDIEEVRADQAIPDSINILVISELRSPLSEREKVHLDAFVDRGGNLFILGGPGRQELMNPLVERFGVRFMPGQLVQPTKDLQADLIQALPTKEGIKLWPGLDIIRIYEGCVAMPGCVGLEYTPVEGVTVTPLFTTDTVGCWNRTRGADFTRDSIVYEPEASDRAGVFATVIALSCDVNGKQQRVVISGNTDCLSNGEFATGRREVRNFNYELARSGFYWLSHEELPVNTSRAEPIDRKLNVSESAMEVWKIVFMVVIPVILAFAGILIWLRRRGR